MACSNLGGQQFWITGSRAFFQRDPIANVPQPLIDMGIVEVINPQLESQTAELKDGDGGVRRLVDELIIDRSEQYDIQTYDCSPDKIAMLFNSAPPAALTQGATPKTNIVHYAHPGKLVKILDNDYDTVPEPRFTLGVTSIEAVTGPSGSPSYTLGTDYEIVSLERGIIRMIAGGAFSTAGEIEIDYTPRAISGNRLIVPAAELTRPIKGKLLIIWGRADNTLQTARVSRVSMVSQTPNFQIENYSTLTFRVKVLECIGAAEPAGRLEYWLGDLPMFPSDAGYSPGGLGA